MTRRRKSTELGVTVDDDEVDRVLERRINAAKRHFETVAKDIREGDCRSALEALETGVWNHGMAQAYLNVHAHPRRGRAHAVYDEGYAKNERALESAKNKFYLRCLRRDKR